MKRKKTFGIAAVMLLGITGGGWWLSMRRAVISLPQGSVKVISVTDWEAVSRQRIPTSSSKFYYWTGTGDLLHSEQNRNGSISVIRDHLTPSNALQRDTTSPVRVPAGAVFLQPTPDGAGLLYWRQSAVHIHDLDVHLLTADGEKRPSPAGSLHG